MSMTWLQTVQGVVTVSIRGNKLEEMVNEATRGGIGLSAIRRAGDGLLECEVTVGDYFRLRPHLKRTGCRIHVLKRRGLPFWLRRLERRKFFAAGLFLFFAGLYVLSSLVWTIEVKGNEKLTTEQVMQAAREEGLYPFQWSFRLQELDMLSKKLVGRLPGVSWIGVDRQGTKVTVEVVESTTPPPLALYSPRHLVASVDAVVTQVKADSGKPAVARNKKVKKGDILISGVIGKDGNTRTVVAKGDVRGLVWYVYEIESPLTQKVKVYTGDAKTQWHLLLGSRTLQVWGFGQPEFDRFESVESQRQLAWRGWTLPLGTVKEQVMEVREDERTLSVEEARALGISRAQAAALDKAGEKARIVEQNILHEKTENGKVYMKVFFEVEQSIAEERAIVQMQGE